MTSAGLRTRRLRLGVVLVLLLGLAALLGAAAWSAWRAAVLAREAQGGLSSLQAGDDVSETDLVAPLRRADRRLRRADEHLDSPAFRVVAAVPLLGRSLRAERAVVDAAGSAVRGVLPVLEAAPALRGRDGSVDVAVLGRLGALLQGRSRTAERDLERLRRTPTALTPPQVGRAVREARTALEPAVASLGRAATGAQLAQGLLGAGQPRNLLVALQNNAELRGSGGYVSSYATGTVRNGRLSLAPFRDVLDVSDQPPAVRRVPAPRDIVEDYGAFLADTTLWRTWNMSPDVPSVASLSATVAGELLGVRPDLVLLLDVPALSSLAELGGGVRLDGAVLAGPDLTRALLVDSYARGNADQDRRRAALQQAAGSALGGLLTAPAGAAETVRRLGRLAEGRHLSVWSARPQEQAQIRSLGLAGEVDAEGGDLVSVNANNLNANKLDYYVDRSVEVSVRLGEDRADVVQRVRLLNSAPEGLVPYVAGTRTPREALERVEFSLSPRARVTGVTVDGRPTRGTLRVAPARTRVATTVRLRPGRPVVLSVAYSLPVTDGEYRVRLVPQPLARDARLRVLAGSTADVPLAGGGPLLADGRRSVRDGPFDAQSRVRLRLAEPAAPSGWRARLRRWWDEPVRLP